MFAANAEKGVRKVFNNVYEKQLKCVCVCAMPIKVNYLIFEAELR